MIKDILSLFFKYSVKGFPVIDDKDEEILGVMTKDKLVELTSHGSNLDLGLGENRSRVILKLDAGMVRAMFGSLESTSAIPILNSSGEIRRVMTRSDLMAVLERKFEPPRPAVTAMPAPAMTVPAMTVPAMTAAGATEAEAIVRSVLSPTERFAILDSLKVPVLLTNTGLVVQFANEQFLETFNFEKDFILRQKVAHFFKGVKLDSALGGTFSYLHKKWQYRISIGVDLNAVVFLEVKETQAPNPVQKDAEKILKGKLNLKSASEAYENSVIRKVHQKLRDPAATARRLGVSEESLKYRLQKMK